jgi:hypothetical protein
MANDFPVEAEQFLALHIESLPQLEALLLVQQDANRTWSREDFARHLYIGPDICTSLIAGLERRGFIVRDTVDREKFRYRPANEATARVIAQLAKIYQERRVAVITQIYSKPTKNVQTFADAFRFRKDP